MRLSRPYQKWFTLLLTELQRIGDVLASLRTSVEQQIDAVDRHEKAEQQRAHANPVIRAELHIPESEKQKKKRNQKNQKWLDWTQTAIQALTLIAVVYYACYAKRQWETMKDTYDQIKSQTASVQTAATAAQNQVTLIRQQLEATQAAVLEAKFTFEQSLSGGVEIEVTISNRGKAIAHDVKAVFNISRRLVVGQKQIGAPIPWPIKIGDLPPTPEDRDATSPFLKPFGSSQVVDRIKNTVEVVRVDGSIAFHNGFNPELIQQPVCQFYLTETLKTKSGKPESTAANWSACENFDSAVGDAKWRLSEAAKRP